MNLENLPKVNGEVELIKLQTLLSISANWHWQTNPQFEFTWLSNGAHKKDAVLANDIVGKTLWDSQKFVPSYYNSLADLKKLMSQKKVFSDFIINYINGVNELISLSFSGVPFFSNKGEFCGYVGNVNNISEYKTKVSGIIRLLQHDPLTGFANWKTLEETYLHSYINAIRRNKSVGLIYLSLPTIIEIQSEFSVADAFELIKNVCIRISNQMRKCDQICRIKLSEICVIFPDIPQDSDLKKIGKKLRANLNTPFLIGGQLRVVKINMVLNSAPKDAHTLEELIDKSKKELGLN